MSRDFDNLDPNLLADLDEEQRFADSIKRRNYMPKVKIERGHSWLIRFLPVQIGKNKSWIGRMAQHWVNQRAQVCKKYTSIHLGGDPNYDCPICKLADNGANHQNKNIKERAQRVMANPFWFGVVLVWAKDTGKGRPTSIKPPECWVAHDCALYKSQFEQLRAIAARDAEKGTEGIVDLRTGRDIWIQRTGKGYKLEADEKSCIAREEKGEDLQQVVDKVWESVIVPDVTLPTAEELREFFLKCKEYVISGGSSDSSMESDNLGRSEESRPKFTRGSMPEGEEVETIDDSLEDQLVSTPPARPVIVKSVEIQTNPKVQISEAKPIQTRVVAPAVTPAPAKSKLVVPQVKQPAAGSSEIIIGSSDEDEEDLPAEKVDHAPPIEVPEQADMLQQPPTVKAPGTKLGINLAERLKKLA